MKRFGQELSILRKLKHFSYVLGRHFNRNAQMTCEVNQNKLKYASQIFVLEGLYTFYFIVNISFVTWKYMF